VLYIILRFTYPCVLRYFNFHREVPQLFLKWAPQYNHGDMKTYVE